MSLLLSLFAALALVGVAVGAALLLHIGGQADPRNGIGRWLGLALVAVPFMAAVLLAFVLAWARGGLVPVWPSGLPAPRGTLLLAVALGAAAVLVALAAAVPVADESASAPGLRRALALSLGVLLPVVGGLALFLEPGGAAVLLARLAWAGLAVCAAAGAGVAWQHEQASEVARQIAKERAARAPGTHLWGREKGRWTYDGKAFEPADPATLEPLSKVFARDAVQGYYRGSPVPGSHGPSFEALSENQARDERAVYWADTYRKGQEYYLVRHLRIETLDGADPARYQVLRYGHGRDHRHAYFEGRRLRQVRDGASFEALTPRLARDAQRGYYEHAEIPGSEGASFELIDRQFDAWVRDRRHAWFVSTGQLEKSGPLVRQVLRLEGAQAAALRPLSNGYASDGRRVWWRGQGLKDADAASFRVLEPGTAAGAAGGAPAASAGPRDAGDAREVGDAPEAREEADARDARGFFKAGRRIGAAAAATTRTAAPPTAPPAVQPTPQPNPSTPATPPRTPR